MSSDLENNIVAVERVKEYSETKTEVSGTVCVMCPRLSRCNIPQKLKLDCACVFAFKSKIALRCS